MKKPCKQVRDQIVWKNVNDIVQGLIALEFAIHMDAKSFFLINGVIKLLQYQPLYRHLLQVMCYSFNACC